jgi:hypothetical protein
MKMTLSLVLLAFCLSSGFAIQSASGQEPAEQAEPRESRPMASAESPEGLAEAETLRHKDRPVSIMDQPLDGSSVEAFTAGMEKVEEEATETEYRSLRSALSYLLFYDIAAKRNKATLYSRLDGLSPNGIIDKVDRSRKGED